jgi:hypothetical protein
MRISKSGHEIRSVDDWLRYAPPKRGERQWKDERSAKELAKAWVGDGTPTPPRELVGLLTSTFGTGIRFDEAKPECVVILDDFAGEHRNCDLVVLCSAEGRRIVINVEAKADEPFGDLIGEYYDRTDGCTSNVPARIRQLSRALFGREPDDAIRKLRYQLLHAAAATLITAAESRADMGLFLVHEFWSPRLNSGRLAQNRADWQGFVHAFPELGTARIEEGQVLGPVSVPGGGRVPGSVPLYLGKLITQLA